MRKPYAESTRMRGVQTPVIPLIAKLIAEHPGTISLGQGVVYYPPPEAAINAARSFGQQLDEHRYGPAAGLPALLERIKVKLQLENLFELERGYEVMVTAGANMAFLNTMLAITDPGDEVILPLPYYFNQEMAVRMVGAVPVCVPNDERFQLDFNRIEAAISPRTRAIVTISPNNPSGVIYPEAALRAVSGLCAKYGIYHISDEAYEYFCFGETPHYSPGAGPDAHEYTISLFSLSKAYGFASWRVGYVVFPKHLVDAMVKIQDTNLICATAVAQQAAERALSVGRSYCTEKIEAIKQVRDACLASLSAIADKLSIVPGEGALYVLVKLETELSAAAVVERLIKEFGVATIPGDTFGLTNRCFSRISFGALDVATAQTGLDRLSRGLRNILK